MKIAAYVPIKLRNTRVPGKNVKQLSDGTPLCSLLFNTLKDVKCIENKYCFCSDEAIKEYLPDGIEFLKRDKSLDTDTTQCSDIIRAFVERINPDIVVLTHVTSPFVSAKTIELCVEKVKSGEYDSAFAVAKEQEFLWKDNTPLNFDPALAPRSQDLPLIYKETNGVFVFTKDIFLKTNRRVGLKPFLCEVGYPETIDINYPEDFIFADATYSYLKGEKKF